MPKVWYLLIYWSPVVAWMVLIFSASADQNSAQTSSRFVEPLFRWLFPEITPEALGRIVFTIRKLAHVVEYAVLSALCWRAIRGSKPQWTCSQAALAFLLAAMYAVTDEWHQTFIPNRQGAVLDVLIDMFGALLGLTVIWLYSHWAGTPSNNLP